MHFFLCFFFFLTSSWCKWIKRFIDNTWFRLFSFFLQFLMSFFCFKTFFCSFLILFFMIFLQVGWTMLYSYHVTLISVTEKWLENEMLSGIIFHHIMHLQLEGNEVKLVLVERDVQRVQVKLWRWVWFFWVDPS